MGHGLAPEQLACWTPLPEPLPLGLGSLEQRYLQEIRGCPRTPQTCCWPPRPIPPGTRPCSGGLARSWEFTAAAAAPAEARLVEIRDRIEFRHPLIRSAVTTEPRSPAASGCTGRSPLATDRTADPDRRAWHLAVGGGLDDAVAAELEQAGDRARRRGGWTTAEAFYKRAALLSGDSPPGPDGC